MRIFHYSLEGLFIGEGVADESPLEPGVYLIPAWATATVPPDVEEGQRVRWSGEAWQVEDVPAPADPEPTVPSVVTMRQARLALHAAGMLTQVDAAIDALPEPPRTEARIEWDFSSTVERNKPFVAMIGQALGLSSEDMDALFIQAAAL